MKLLEYKNADMLGLSYATLDYVRNLYNDNSVTDEKSLANYAKTCHGAFLRILSQSNVLLKIGETEPQVIDFTRGGGWVRTEKDAKPLFDFVVYAESTNALAEDILRRKISRAGSKANKGDAVCLVRADGTEALDVLGALVTIRNFYSAAYNNIMHPEKVEAETAKHVENFRQYIENAIANRETTEGKVTPQERAFALGWLAKNVTRIDAKIPERGDFLATFLSTFNDFIVSDDCYTVRPDGLTSGGNPNQLADIYYIHLTPRAARPGAVDKYILSFKRANPFTGMLPSDKITNPITLNGLAAVLVKVYGFVFGDNEPEVNAENILQHFIQNAEEEQNFRAGYGEGAEKFPLKFIEEKDPYDDDYDFFDLETAEFPEPINDDEE